MQTNSKKQTKEEEKTAASQSSAEAQETYTEQCSNTEERPTSAEVVAGGSKDFSDQRMETEVIGPQVLRTSGLHRVFSFSDVRNRPETVPAEETIKQKEKEVEELLSKLEDYLETVNEIVSPARNIHKTVKSSMKLAMKVLQKLKLARSDIKLEKAKLKRTNQQRVVGFKAPEEVGSNQRTKRTAASPLSQPEDKRKQPRRLANQTSDGPTTPTGTGAWITAQRKKKDKTRRDVTKHERPRPSAIILRKKADSNTSYAEILSKVKKDQDLKELEDSVSKIRRTAKGDLMLVLDCADSEKADKLKTLVQGKMNDEFDIESRTQGCDVEIRDIDEFTTKEEVLDALKSALGDTSLRNECIRSLRRAFRDTQIATVRLSSTHAMNLLQAGIKIGWVRCRVREKVWPTHCFRCWRFGHVAAKCNSEVDRSKDCRKCGGRNHKAADCDKEEVCALCTEDGRSGENKHRAGSTRCPIFRDALKAATNKRSE
jgi:hypothetical protein